MRQRRFAVSKKVIVGVVAASLAGGGAWAAVVADSGQEAVDCSVTEVETFVEAEKIAVACGHNVGVLDTYDPWSRQVATPAASAIAEFSAGAVRTDLSGEWREVDPTVVVDEATGELKVASPVYDITLDPRDSDAFLRIGDDGAAVSVAVPFDLGTAVLDGTTAAWPILDDAGRVIEGAVLKARVHEDASGVTPVIEVRDPEAYALVSEAGAGEISFEVSGSGGIELDASPASGAFVAVDAATGEPIFAGGEALQWDSAGVGEASPVEAPVSAEPTDLTPEPVSALDELVLGEHAHTIPVPGDAVAELDVAVIDQDTIKLIADESMADDPETEWPIAIDPPIGASLNDWTALSSSGWSHYNLDAAEGVGFCDVSKAASCATDFKSRLFWDFNDMAMLKNLEAADIQKATFSAYGTHSYDCSGYQLRVYLMESGVNSNTTWSNQPDVVDHLATQSPKHREGQCGEPSRISWDVTDGAKARAGVASTMSLRMAAASEGSMSSWRRYKMHTAQLSVEYNRAPAKPTGLVLSDGATPRACVTGTGRPYVTTARPQFSAVATDPDKDSVKANYELYAGATLVWSVTTGAQASGKEFPQTVPAANALQSGTVYKWRVRAIDADSRGSAWAGWCEFTVDTVKPVAPTITPDTNGSGFEAVYSSGLERGGKGMRGCFVISRGSSSDVSRITYSRLDGASGTVAATLSDGKVRVCHSGGAPLTTGTQVLTAYSTDVAGNISPTASFSYEVATAREDGVWSFDAKSATVVDETKQESGEAAQAGAMTVTGGAWLNGPHRDFASRETDYALDLNGTSTFGVTKAPVFDTRQSFVVSAHVMLTATDKNRTVLSQDGLSGSAWALRYQTTGCATSSEPGCWAFSTYNATGAVTKTVVSPTVPATSSWVHLTAEYDKPEGKMRLWVCEAGTPASPAPGVPAVASVSGVPAMWQAPGPFVVGRGLTANQGTDWWKGRIDNVRIFKGEVLAESKVRRMCQGAEARDFTEGIDGLDPTKAVN